MATIHHFPHRVAAARPRGQGTPNPVLEPGISDAERNRRFWSEVYDRPRGFVRPLPRAHLRMVEPGERIDLYASLRDGGQRPHARHPASPRQRDDALDRATALGFVGLSVMLLVALAIGAMLAVGRV